MERRNGAVAVDEAVLIGDFVERSANGLKNHSFEGDGNRRTGFKGA
jgi:hypothetical protein